MIVPWVRISDDFTEHPKIRDLSAPAVAMWLAGIAYANRNLTDGIIPARVTGGLIITSGVFERSGRGYREVTASDVVRQLVAQGLWHDLDSSCATCPRASSRQEYVVHDYLEYQPSREKIQVEREKTRTRVERYRAARNDSNGVGNAVTDTRTNGDVTRAPKSQSQELPRQTESSHDSYREEGATDSAPSSKFLEKYAAQAGLIDVPAIVEQLATHTGIRVTGDRAIGVARWILDKSPRPPRAPQRYVLTAIERSAPEIEQHILSGVA